MYRYIKDEKYGGYSIQLKRKLLWWEWWSNEYITGYEEEAKRFIDTYNLKLKK